MEDFKEGGPFTRAGLALMHVRVDQSVILMPKCVRSELQGAFSLGMKGTDDDTQHGRCDELSVAAATKYH